MVPCPECGVAIQPTWDWCHSCGFDPEGLKPAGWTPAAPIAPVPSAAPRPGFLPASPHAPPYPTATGYPAGPGAGYGPGFNQGYGPPPARPTNAGATVLKVLAVVGIAFVLLVVVSIGAVTLLGKNASSKFSQIGTAVDDPAAASTPTTAAGWQPYTSPDGRATIEFPGLPSDHGGGSSPTDGVSNLHDLIYGTPTGEYEFGYFDVTFGHNFTDATAALNGAVDGIVSANQVTNVSRTNSTFAGMPSIEFNGTGTFGGDKGDVRGLAVIDGKRMYVINTISQVGQVPPDWDHFVNSWRLN